MSETVSSTYCKLSHVSLAVQNRGDCCVCNKNTASLPADTQGTPAYLDNTGLQKMWNNMFRRMVPIELDKGNRIESCQACWNDEDAGVVSTRQMFNESLKDLEPALDQPRILILKPSNVCNLGCRMCQPTTSTGLYQDFYKLDTELNSFTGTFKEYTSQFEPIRDGFGRDNLPVWNTFEDWIPGLTFLDLYGGEPLLAPAMWERMIRAANAGKTGNTDIQMHTNGTIWNQEYIDCFTKFKTGRIGVSIDASDPAQLAYIRHGVNVARLNENLEKFIELSKQHTNISVYICLTVSIYNIWYVDEILAELDKYGIYIGVNVVYGPEQYDFRHMPDSTKWKIRRKFANSPVNSNPKYKAHLDHLLSLLDHIIPGCDVWWPKFWKEVQALDRIRDQKFADVFPEYYEALKPHLPE
jgi:wyosine [tRNA(Phe)-imidazoG37] synthetase (radical SAM superfamily)